MGQNFTGIKITLSHCKAIESTSPISSSLTTKIHVVVLSNCCIPHLSVPVVLFLCEPLGDHRLHTAEGMLTARGRDVFLMVDTILTTRRGRAL